MGKLDAVSTILILLGTEIQGYIHYAMPVKNGMYDFITYDDQIDDKANQL